MRAVAHDAERAATRRLATVTPTADPSVLARAISAFPIGCNFHPDRLAADGRSVVEGLLDDGVYRSQFETRISNGGLTAFPGGDRDRWEQALFGGAYQRPEVVAADRPKYGGLDLFGWADGPCPRFGSCHLELAPAVLARTTFTFGDSHAGPTDLGTGDALLPVVAALVEDDPSVVGRVLAGPARRAEHGRRLDEYVEAQVHGPIRLSSDVVAVTADPSFRATRTEESLTALAQRYGLSLRWHDGFYLPADNVPADFRGPAVPLLAARIADEWGDADLHAARLGEVARDVVSRPPRWGDPVEALQRVKQLWHVLVAHGRPLTSR